MEISKCVNSEIKQIKKASISEKLAYVAKHVWLKKVLNLVLILI